MSAVDGWGATARQNHPRYRTRNVPVQTEGLSVTLQRVSTSDPAADPLLLTTQVMGSSGFQRVSLSQQQALHLARTLVQLVEPTDTVDLPTFDAAFGAIDDCSRHLHERTKVAKLAVDRDAVMQEVGYTLRYDAASPSLKRMVDLVLEARS